MAKWDIARTGMTCKRRGCDIGQGEAFRVGRFGAICEDCSIDIDEEAAPPYVDERTFEERMRDEAAQVPPRHLPKGPVMPHPGSQPTVDPRALNRRHQRHGVVEAVRATTETDWHKRRHDDWAKRASGDTD